MQKYKIGDVVWFRDLNGKPKSGLVTKYDGFHRYTVTYVCAVNRANQAILAKGTYRESVLYLTADAVRASDVETEVTILT